MALLHSNGASKHGEIVVGHSMFSPEKSTAITREFIDLWKLSSSQFGAAMKEQSAKNLSQEQKTSINFFPLCFVIRNFASLFGNSQSTMFDKTRLKAIFDAFRGTNNN
jgi:hypothetical protein